jgi:hypothetical protein
MKKKYMIAMFFALSVSGCFTPKIGTIRTGPADYDAMKASSPSLFETRVFVKKSAICNYTNKDDESGVEIAVASFIINFIADKAEEAIKNEAAYLNAEVSSSGSSLLSLADTPFWPSLDVLNNYTVTRDRDIENAVINAERTYKANHSGVKDDDAGLVAAKNKVKEAAGAEYDKSTPTVNIDPKESLCILAITGEYSNPGKGNEIKSKYKNTTGAKDGPLDNYELVIPGLKRDASPSPFQGLSEDPSFVTEIQIIPVGKKDVVQYFIVPKNIFYPNPLHKHTFGGLERTITIGLTLGDRNPVITLEKMKSGNNYTSKILSTRYTSFESPREKAFQSLQVKILEGTDSMPAADLLTATAAKKTDIAKALVDKASEVLAEDEKKK